MSQGKDPNDPQMKDFLAGMRNRFWKRENEDFIKNYMPEAQAMHKELIVEVPEANDSNVDWGNAMAQGGYITGVRISLKDMTCAFGVKLLGEKLIPTTGNCPVLP